MITRVVYRLKHNSKANLKSYEYYIDTNTHSVKDAGIKFKADLSLLAKRKNTTMEELRKYYKDKPKLKVIKLIE
jgi:hypothetical protein